MGGGVRIGIIEKVLHTNQNLKIRIIRRKQRCEIIGDRAKTRVGVGKGYLFDCDRRFPSLVFVEDGETDSSRGIHIRMKQWRIKFT